MIWCSHSHPVKPLFTLREQRLYLCEENTPLVHLKVWEVILWVEIAEHLRDQTALSLEDPLSINTNSNNTSSINMEHKHETAPVNHPI